MRVQMISSTESSITWSLAAQTSYLGPAGAGKSVTLRASKSAIEAQGLTVAAICLPHTGACNIGVGAVTARSFVHKFVLNGTFSVQVMSWDLLAALETRLCEIRLLYFGDWRQLPPVCNKWCGQRVNPNLI